MTDPTDTTTGEVTEGPIVEPIVNNGLPEQGTIVTVPTGHYDQATGEFK